MAQGHGQGLQDLGTTPMRMWDFPVRCVHWLMVLLVAFCWVSAKSGWLVGHKFAGYAILSLLIFRIYWGFCGSSTARFGQFLRGPRAVLHYARGVFRRSEQHASFGHNPLGGWNVIALLALLILETGSGLVAVDVDGLESGPLAHYVTFTIGREFARWHATLFGWLLWLIGLHVAAVLLHLVWRRENLIIPMLTGTKQVPRGHMQVLRTVALWRAVTGLAVSILLLLLLLVVM